MAKDFIGSKKRKTNHSVTKKSASGKSKSSSVPKNNLMKVDMTDQSK